jgi:hypothetical protein
MTQRASRFVLVPTRPLRLLWTWASLRHHPRRHRSTRHVHPRIACRICGKPVQRARECYAIPVCFTCLPPPPPLPICGLPSVRPTPIAPLLPTPPTQPTTTSVL